MNVSRIRFEPQQWFWVALIWSTIGLFDATQTVFGMRAEGMHHAWVRLFITLLLSWLPWALATPLVLRLGRRSSLGQLKPVSNWLTHAAALIIVAVVTAAWTAWLEKLLNPWAKSPAPGPFMPLWFGKIYNGLLASLILYISILAIGYVLDSRARLAFQRTETARLNEQLSKAQLNALRRQIEPHFLFNTLNAVAALIREQRNDAAVTMIAGLSDFFRRTLEGSDAQQVPLGEEMEFLQKYLDIQKVRFAERLQVTVDVPPELLLAQVPSLIMQPIVENAVKHGIAKRAQGGVIRISVLRSNGMLKLKVYNGGPALPANLEEINTGIGISNIRTRLQGLYGNVFELSMRNQDPGGVEMSVSVPFREG
ncbi:MAG TPA: histidine kinase [Terriglobales bacterium]|nr:histidine kinase [Terriglobales bacterium]